MPFRAHADAVDTFIETLSREVLNPLVMLMFALALIYFVWGVIKFIANSENPTEMEAGKQSMIWGVVGMLIMVGVYGIIAFITGSLGI